MPARSTGLALAGLTRSATAVHRPGSAGPNGCPGARPASASHTLIRVSTIATCGTPYASLASSVEGPVQVARGYCQLVFEDLPGLCPVARPRDMRMGCLTGNGPDQGRPCSRG